MAWQIVFLNVLKICNNQWIRLPFNREFQPYRRRGYINYVPKVTVYKNKHLYNVRHVSILFIYFDVMYSPLLIKLPEYFRHMFAICSEYVRKNMSDAAYFNAKNMFTLFPMYIGNIPNISFARSVCFVNYGSAECSGIINAWNDDSAIGILHL